MLMVIDYSLYVADKEIYFSGSRQSRLGPTLVSEVINMINFKMKPEATFLSVLYLIIFG